LNEASTDSRQSDALTKLHDEFTLTLPLAQASSACVRAVAATGWNLKEEGPHRIVTKIGVAITRNPSKIEVLLSESGDQTVVRLNGSILGVGPLQKGHLTAEINRLRSEIEAAAGGQRARE
jgi:hypothetical protein